MDDYVRYISFIAFLSATLVLMPYSPSYIQ